MRREGKVGLHWRACVHNTLYSRCFGVKKEVNNAYWRVNPYSRFVLKFSLIYIVRLKFLDDDQ